MHVFPLIQITNRLFVILAPMFDFIASFGLTPYQWFLLLGCGLMVGMSKTGVQGLGMLVAPLLAAVFGGKFSAGLLLPMLAMADVFGVWHYNRHAEWRYILRLLPFALAGILIGIYVGEVINDRQFKHIMAAIILISLALMIWRERYGGEKKIPESWWFSGVIGLAGGFSTMIGNAAGPVMALYLLSMRLPKNSFIGTGAWFFLIVNYIKIPFHIVVWETITWESLSLNLVMLPVILVGAFLGIVVVKMIPDKPYRVIVIIATAIAALRLLF